MKLVPAFLVAALFALPSATNAQSRPFEISGWIPYWRTATGTADATANIDVFSEVNPFTFTMSSDGTINDAGATLSEPWTTLRSLAAQKKIRFIPTIMSSDREALHRILTDKTSRAKLVDDIGTIVHASKFDGIDIDFENKRAETRDAFSAFLRELKQRLGPDKWLMCTIESRTPLEDRYWGTTPPADAGVYANDLRAINDVCDRVRIMTYDQQSIDLRLREESHSRGEVYGPVADTRWVEKVVNMMSKEISKSKMMVGVPTYGYAYDVTAYANNEYIYDILFTFNPGYAAPIAAEFGITPHRGPHGDMYFTYLPTASSTPPEGSTAPRISGQAAAAAASQFAQTNNANVSFRLLDWPDAESVRQKAELAKRLGVRGISIFKIDGGEDPAIWNALRPYVTAVSPSAPSVPTPSAGSRLTRDLTLNSRGADVKLLQQILNADARTRIAASGPGSPGSETQLFGPATKRAVQKFQALYGIAKPGSAGYGRVGPATRAKLNQLAGSI